MKKSTFTTLDEDDATAFKQAVADIEPLNEHNRVPLKDQHITQKKPDLTEPEIDQNWSEKIELVELGEPLSYLRQGVSKSTLKRLRKGQYSIEDSIDLHNLTLLQAQTLLEAFLNDALMDQYIAVKIIHGKGLQSNHHFPVLKNMVNQTLRLHPAIEAFCSTGQKQGGTGAVLVKLSLAE